MLNLFHNKQGCFETKCDLGRVRRRVVECDHVAFVSASSERDHFSHNIVDTLSFTLSRISDLVLAQELLNDHNRRASVVVEMESDWVVLVRVKESVVERILGDEGASGEGREKKNPHHSHEESKARQEKKRSVVFGTVSYFLEDCEYDSH